MVCVDCTVWIDNSVFGACGMGRSPTGASVRAGACAGVRGGLYVAVKYLFICVLDQDMV